MNTLKIDYFVLCDLALFWCKYNGQRGTDKQITKLVNRYQDHAEVLARMCIERGYRNNNLDIKF